MRRGWLRVDGKGIPDSTRILLSRVMAPLAAALLSWAFLAGAFAANLDSDIEYSKSVERAKSGDFEGASELLLSVLRRWPRNPRVHYSLGMAYLKLGRKEEARREALAILETDPMNSLGLELTRQSMDSERDRTSGRSASVLPALAAVKVEALSDRDECHLDLDLFIDPDGRPRIDGISLQDGPPRGDPVPAGAPRGRVVWRCDAATEARAVGWPGSLVGVVESIDEQGRLTGSSLPSQGIRLLIPIPGALNLREVRIEGPDAKDPVRLNIDDDTMTQVLEEFTSRLIKPPVVPSMIEPEAGIQPLIEAAIASMHVNPTLDESGRYTGLALRMRVIAELYVESRLTRIQEDLIPQVSNYLRFPAPILSPDLRPGMARLQSDLARYLNTPGEGTARKVTDGWSRARDKVHDRIRSDLVTYRVVLDPRPVELEVMGRATLTLARIAHRLERIMTFDSSDPWMSRHAAEALLLLGRFR